MSERNFLQMMMVINEFCVKSICVQTIDIYDHQRQRALVLHKWYPEDGPKLPVWEWVIIREDDRRFRFRCSYNNPKQTFFTEWKCGEQVKHLGPPSTGAGKDSKRNVDGHGIFRRSNYHYHGNGPPKPPGTGSAGSSAGGTGTGGGWQPRGSGGDGPGCDNTPGSWSGQSVSHWTGLGGTGRD